MPKATYSEQLLTDISNGTWRESELDLSDQKLDTIAAQKLASALAQNKMLTSLNLHGNNIRAEGAKALAQNKTLTSLNLDSNSIGTKGVKALAQNTTLTSLNLDNNNIGAEGKKALSEMLMRNKKFRQASLTTAINQVIAVLDLIPTILEYSADYTAEEACQHTGKTTKDDKQADEESTHSQAQATNTPASNQFDFLKAWEFATAHTHAAMSQASSSEFFATRKSAKKGGKKTQPSQDQTAVVFSVAALTKR